MLKSKALEASEKAREAAEKRHSKDSENIQARGQDIRELNAQLEQVRKFQTVINACSAQHECGSREVSSCPERARTATGAGAGNAE